MANVGVVFLLCEHGLFACKNNATKDDPQQVLQHLQSLGNNEASIDQGAESD